MRKIIGIVAFILAAAVLSAGCVVDSGDDNLPVGLELWSVAGGDGLIGVAGEGGVIQAVATEGPATFNGGDEIEQDFFMPDVLDPFLGYEPMVVDQDYTLTVYPDQAGADAGAADGDYLLLLDSDTVWLRQAPGDYIGVSGLKVAEGATLTVGLNHDLNSNLAQETAQLTFDHDVVIRGILRVATLDTGNLVGSSVEPVDGAPATDRDRGSLTVLANNIFVSGAVDTAGVNAEVDGDRGGFGGAVNLQGLISLTLTGMVTGAGGYGAGDGRGGDGGSSTGVESALIGNFGSLDISGRVNLSGGRGGTGGNGGNIVLYTLGVFRNTGEVSVSGDSGDNGDGGDGGSLIVISQFQPGLNTGALIADGGHAIEGGAGPVVAGNGGAVHITSNMTFYQHGAVEADGGILIGDGIAGDGGSITITQPLDNIFATNGWFSAHGGPGYGGAGGNGGVLSLQITGRGRFFGTLDFRGGGGDTGGNGGTINIQAASLEAGLNGYLSANGGRGQSGGNAGTVTIQASAHSIGSNRLVTARGGDGFDGNGGMGGIIVIDAFGRARAEGELNVRGGDGTRISVGGIGGNIIIDSGTGHSVPGPYNARGGQAGTDGAKGLVTVDGTVVFP